MSFEKLKPELGDWYDVLKDRVNDQIFNLMVTAAREYQVHKCYPEFTDIFRAFRETPYNKVKVVILGQDPYHDGNATGLSFDCKNRLTPSMRGIIDAYSDYDPQHFNVEILDGKVSQWTKEGVLLLNTALTVQEGKANSHAKYWMNFTKCVVDALNARKEPVIFMLWGAQAQKYAQFIDDRHHIIETEHPVAGVYKGKKWDHKHCFRRANEILGDEKINW